MSMTTLAPVESILTRPADDDETCHLVCHCTNDGLSACGLDVTDEPWDEESDECPLCLLVWPDDAPTCPWGCGCDEECGP